MPYAACPYCQRIISTRKLLHHVTVHCLSRPIPATFKHILPPKAVPQWLTDLAEYPQLPATIPLDNILDDSCFYPASGKDASPIIIANGCVHSFIYVDYGIIHNNYLNSLVGGLSGYELLIGRDVQLNEVDDAVWDLPGKGSHQPVDQFGHWSIWKRKEGLDDRIGPPLFSLLFLAAEGVAAFRGLYSCNRITPKLCAIINPGHSFGGNWTKFWDPTAPFWEAVKAGAGLPEFLLLGTWHKEHKPDPFDGYHFRDSTSTVELTEVRTQNEEGETVITINLDQRLYIDIYQR